MSYIALYRKWRPITFDDVVEQSGVVSILKNAVKQDRVGHAYLFCGTRGTGKTTIAKIFSRAINCLQPIDGNPCNTCEVCQGILNQSLLDVIEIDAASNNGVDNIRDIIEEIAYVPTRARFKVYIIDEVHMLSTGAFNALLKTLEEPPAHAVFLLATTDPQKLPATILSRCQRFEFKRISTDSIVERLRIICDDAKVDAKTEALYFIAQAADGGLRDAISILDQCLSAGGTNLTLAEVQTLLGATDETFLADVVRAVAQNQVEQTLLLVDQMTKAGKEIPDFVSAMISYLRNLLVTKATGSAAGLGMVTTGNQTDLQELAKLVGTEQLIFYINTLSRLEKDLKWSSQKKILLEVGLMQMCMGQQAPTPAPVAPAVPKATAPAKPKAEPAKQETVQEASKEETKAPASPTRSAIFKMQPVATEDLRDVGLELKDRKHMMVLSYLRNVQALYYNENTIYLVFCGAGKEVKKDSMAKPENMTIITEVFAKILDKNCQVKLFTEDELNREQNTKPEESKDVLDRLGQLADDGIPVKIT